MRDFLIEAVSFLVCVSVLFAIGYGIVQLAQENENTRERQRADCIAIGGKYAESQRPNASPRDDYCIR